MLRPPFVTVKEFPFQAFPGFRRQSGFRRTGRKRSLEAQRDLIVKQYGQEVSRRETKSALVPVVKRINKLNESQKKACLSLKMYRSGELTVGRYHKGLDARMSLAARAGALVTSHLTKSAKTKIRRAVQNTDTELRYFCTLTFAPRVCDRLGKLTCQYVNEETGEVFRTVDHVWAKEELKRFLNTISHHVSRKDKDLQYLWVAEVQPQTGNIHFHILWNQFVDVKYLTRIWRQAVNSVDIKSLKDAFHAACYMSKYMRKPESDGYEIQGNRYFISKGLRDAMRPVLEEVVQDDVNQNRKYKEVIDSISDEVKKNGGIVFDYGVYIPPARERKFWKDKAGHLMMLDAVDKHKTFDIFDTVAASARLPF